MFLDSGSDRYSLFCTDWGKARPWWGMMCGREDGHDEYGNGTAWYLGRCIQTGYGNSKWSFYSQQDSASNLGGRRFQHLSTTIPGWEGGKGTGGKSLPQGSLSHAPVMERDDNKGRNSQVTTSSTESGSVRTGGPSNNQSSPLALRHQVWESANSRTPSNGCQVANADCVLVRNG